jgi:hypothetical protein
MDAYHQGLDGKQAAWASRKYRGHRTIPDTLMEDMHDASRALDNNTHSQMHHDY